jgi:CBS domain-containing protein
MHALAGDRIVVRVGFPERAPRQGTIRDVLREPDGEHYRVAWDDGHESVICPGPDASIIPAQISREQPPPPPARPRVVRPSDSVELIMSAPVVTIDEHDSLRVTAVTLADSEVGALVVLSGTTPLGIISERDVVHALAAGAKPDDVLAANVLGVTAIWASPADSISRVAKLMRDAGVRHIPLRTQDTLVGIVSIRDILEVMYSHWSTSQAISPD